MSFEGLSADDDTRLVEFSESRCDIPSIYQRFPVLLQYLFQWHLNVRHPTSLAFRLLG